MIAKINFISKVEYFYLWMWVSFFTLFTTSSQFLFQNWNNSRLKCKRRLFRNYYEIYCDLEKYNITSPLPFKINKKMTYIPKSQKLIYFYQVINQGLIRFNQVIPYEMCVLLTQFSKSFPSGFYSVAVYSFFNWYAIFFRILSILT